MDTELLSIVVNYKTDNLLKEFLNSYQKYVKAPGRKLAIINIEDDHKVKEFLKVPGWDFWKGFRENVGYARAINHGVSVWGGQARNLAFFNADTKFVDSNCVDSCLDLLDSNDDVAVVGPLQYDKNGQVTHAGKFGGVVGMKDRGFRSRRLDQFREIEDCQSVSGSAYFTKNSVWWELATDPVYREIDPESEGAFLTTDMYYEETWYSVFAASKGYRILFNGEAEMVHHLGKSPNPLGESKIADARRKYDAACKRAGLK